MRVLATTAYKARETNPYNWLLYTHITDLGVDVEEFSFRRILKGRYSVWHLHWPDYYLNRASLLKAFSETKALLLLMDWARARGTKIIWTIHNLSSHENFHPRLESRFWRVFTSKLDGCISLSESGLKEALKRFPNLKNIPGFVTAHGHYREEYPTYTDPQRARNRLGISSSAKVLLFFGTVRPYKNVIQLLRAFREYPDPEVVLYIAGLPSSPALAEVIVREAKLDARVRLHLGFIHKDKVHIYFQATDLVILPYREILNSGGTLLALSFSRPVCVPSRGALSELQAQVGKEWVHTYTGELTSLRIEEAVKWALGTSRSAQAPLEVFDWRHVAQQTINAYNVIVAQ